MAQPSTDPVPAQQPPFAVLVADAVLREPALLAKARETCQRWRHLQAQPVVWLDRWDDLLTKAQSSAAGMAQLQHVLRSDDAQSARWREFAPLAGLLPREVRRTARNQCGFRH